MELYLESAVVQAGSHVICVAEMCEAFKKGRKHKYAMLFTFQETVKSEGVARSISTTAGTMGVKIDDPVARYFLRQLKDLNFPVRRANSIGEEDQVEVINRFENRSGGKHLYIVRVNHDDYFGFVQLDRNMPTADRHAIVSNVNDTNAFNLPSELGQLFLVANH
ncbi:hypothetical protein [Vibrio hippocampi]|uniref:Uncharacterized protein n=1 Tax=Vibrio hippocampi TaxID=654686 RepID=A0ABM8ZME9_9VIBR|nr:hypothetical protein [Vibrio hippocampi]CAH0529715.1 hypothetical protein VHP8226_03471 [Vibrio hippocampi]